ncbi:MAG: hypothetical protein ACJ75H_22520, partial [Thermoanaerobaculia bacterium]
AVLSLALVLGAATTLTAVPLKAAKPETVMAHAQWAEVYDTPGALIAGADLIVIARHVAAEPGRVIANVPFTNNGFEIQRTVKGVYDGNVLVVEQTGGRMNDGTILSVDDGGPYVPGNSYLLFLKAQGGNGIYYQINRQGRYEIERGGRLKAVAAGWNGCLKYADFRINWFNGGTGDYFNIYEEEARTDANAWDPYTDVALTPVAAAGTTDHISAYNAAYGATGWLSLTQVVTASGCTVQNGRIRLNQTYLDNGSYTRNQKKAVACNAIGKILGLTNQAWAPGCMDGTLNNPFPSIQDRDTINSIY